MEKLVGPTPEEVLKGVIGRERRRFKDGEIPEVIYYPMLLEFASTYMDLGDTVSAISLILQVPISYLDEGLVEELCLRPTIFHDSMVTLTNKLLLAGIVDMGQVPTATQAKAEA